MGIHDDKKAIAGFFSGTGGIELGFQQAGFEPVYSNDMDKYSAGTYALNFDGEHYELEDINKVDFSRIPLNTTVIAGGFPCQAFSIAGYRQGFNDEKGRGDLFYRIMDAAVEKEPEVIFLENVKNLVGHDEGKTFKTIRETLENLGYYVHWQVMNSKDYGNIPQGRERIYIVGFKDKEASDRFSFPEKVELTTKITDLVDFENKVDVKYYYTADKNPAMWDILSSSITEEGVIYQWRRKYVRANKSGVAPTLTANMGTGGHNVPLVLTKHGIRKLTPRECFNLMGYPQDFQLPDQSDSRLYKQSGNAVVVPVIKRIAERVRFALDGH
jgi:DNA (cytosine-5)-methyltransferase 1